MSLSVMLRPLSSSSPAENTTLWLSDTMRVVDTVSERPSSISVVGSGPAACWPYICMYFGIVWTSDPESILAYAHS
eukprot:5179203-Heterocapsa_arctica.AAC.1